MVSYGSKNRHQKGNSSLMGLYRGHSNTIMCLIFNYVVKAKWRSLLLLERDNPPPSNFNCQSMVRDAVSNDDLAMRW